MFSFYLNYCTTEMPLKATMKALSVFIIINVQWCERDIFHILFLFFTKLKCATVAFDYFFQVMNGSASKLNSKSNSLRHYARHYSSFFRYADIVGYTEENLSIITSWKGTEFFPVSCGRGHLLWKESGAYVIGQCHEWQRWPLNQMAPPQKCRFFLPVLENQPRVVVVWENPSWRELSGCVTSKQVFVLH